MKKANNNINYRNMLSYINSRKNFIFAIIFVFLFSIFLGFFIPLPQDVQKRILDLIKEIFLKLEGKGFLDLFLSIFFNNLTASFFGLFLGIFSGFIPILYGFVNGFLVGFVSYLVVGQEGFLSLWKLLPHGIFELPAIFISLGLGLNLGITLINNGLFYLNPKISKREHSFFVMLSVLFFPISFLFFFTLSVLDKNLFSKIYYELVNSFLIFIFVVVPLLLIGAFIESALINFI